MSYFHFADETLYLTVLSGNLETDKSPPKVNKCQHSAMKIDKTESCLKVARIDIYFNGDKNLFPPTGNVVTVFSISLL